MDKLRYAKLIHILIVVMICNTWLQLNLVQADPEEEAILNANRGNPFAAILKQGQAQAQTAQPVAQLSQEKPKLIAKMVTLNHLNANNTAEAFSCMISGFGIISVLEKSNSLIIFDTEEDVQKITKEIERLDIPVPGMMIAAVALQSLDAKATLAALEKMCSEDGIISLAEKSNSLIICDIRQNVEAILQEIARIDKPMPGMLTEAVMLQYLDAKSAQIALSKMLSESGNISVIERTNSLVICDAQRNINMILAEIGKIDIPTSGLFVETVNLKFLEAKNLKVVIDKMVSEFGAVATNDKTNSIIICDTKENLAKILNQIEKADKTPEQIMVEVVILDVKLEDDTEIGINWDLLSSNRYDVTYRQNLTSSRLSSTIESTDTIGNATAFNTVGLAAGDFSVISGTIRHVVHMIQTKRNAEIIASPRAMVVSGQTASIKAVEQIPYTEVSDTAEGGSGALTSTEFKDVGVEFQVSATVTDKDQIFLTINTEQSVRTSESSGGIPVVDTRVANTSLLLKDGQIVVLGGLRRQEKTKQINQIPLLGDLPIIGLLFKNNNLIINNSELVVLLSPRIYKGEPIPDDVIAKYDQVKNKPLLSIPSEPDKFKLEELILEDK